MDESVRKELPMKKDAFYFPHYCNARHDRKIKRVIKELGVEGYGIYFMLLEVLREQTDFRYPIDDIDLLADEFGTSEQKVRTVISNYQLFETDPEERFFSIKMIYYLQPYIEKSERARTAANTRWGNVQDRIQSPKIDANAYANALPEQCASNASKVKESKVKESKVKESKVNKKQLMIVSPSSRLEHALNDFIEFRISIKKPLTERGLELLRGQLDKLGQSEAEKIEILNQSIVNGWQGVFQLKQSTQKNSFLDQAERMREW